MKKRVLIVEDDKFFRFAVKKVINWEKYGFEVVGEAVHGAKALEFLEENPVEVVVTDMSMPVMNGIELTAAIKERYPDILIIALSAYDDFEFVRESLKLGAEDYILKQDIEKEDVGAIIWKTWHKHFEKLINQGQSRTEILDFLSGKKDGEGRHFLELSVDNQWGYYLCRIRNLNEEWQSPECRKEVWMEQSLVELHEKRRHILLLPVIKEHSQKLQMEDRSKRLLELEGILKDEDYLAGCSSTGTEVTDLPAMSHEAECAAEMAKFSGKRRVLIWEYVRSEYESRNETFMEEKEAYAGICSIEQGKDALYQLTEKLRSMLCSEEYVQKNYLLFLNTIAKNMQHEMDKMRFAEIREELAGAARIEKKQEICSHYLETLFAECGSVTRHPGVQQAIRYMRENYSKDLSLGDIAGEAALNEGYFSGLFKKDTGKSITEYLNEIRMEKAKELLVESNLKNYEVAEQVGFRNASYFSTMFKKYTGMTIQEYRQSQAGRG